VRARVLLVWLSCCVLWGSTWTVVRLGLEDLPPLRFAGARMCLAGALLAPWALRRGAVPADAPWRWMAGIGLLQIAIPYGLMFTAQQFVPSSLAAVLFATFPVWVALLARFALPGERLGPARIASVLLGVAGVAVLQSRALSGAAAAPRAALGGALVVLAAIVCAAANVLVKRRAASVSPGLLTCAQTVAAGPALLVASLAFEHGRASAWTTRALGAVGYLAVFGTVLTYLGLYWLMPRVSIALVATIPLLDTAIAVCLGAALLGEPVGWHLALGGAMVLAAAALAERSSRPAPAAYPATAKRGASAQRPSRS
jgi:drug/metabolite transporter (DMT)-like permease